jgi:hypothetical protein
VHPRTVKIIAIFLLLLFLPAALAILLAIFAHPLFLLLLLVCAFSIPFFRAVKG